jgi:hypothetical protein
VSSSRDEGVADEDEDDEDEDEEEVSVAFRPLQWPITLIKVCNTKCNSWLEETVLLILTPLPFSRLSSSTVEAEANSSQRSSTAKETVP